jgi:hypothetical protein
MKKLITFLVVFLSLAIVVPVLAKNARLPAARLAADRVVELQRSDLGWEGTWYWYVGSSYNATNLTGITALGLIEAYKDTKSEVFLDASVKAAEFIMSHLGVGATEKPPYHVRTTAPDIVFLHRLTQVTGDSSYSERAVLEWENIKNTYPTAGSLDSLFRATNRPSTWDIAFFLEAAYLSGDYEWSNDAAAILADTEDSFYYNLSSGWYALNVAGSIRALTESGYLDEYSDEVVYLLEELSSLSSEDAGISGWVQDTAYGVLAFRAVGGIGHQYANNLARWLASQQEENGGWLEGGYEYPEINGEITRALSSTIGKNIVLEGWKAKKNYKSTWKKGNKAEIIEPFITE